MSSSSYSTTIDRFGRIVLPKEMRNHLHLVAGTELEIEEREDTILLKPVSKSAKITEKNGWLVAELEDSLQLDDLLSTLQKVRNLRNQF